jgi:hypothetical protein
VTGSGGETPISSQRPERLRPLDYYQVGVTILLVLLGGWILLRAAAEGFPPLSAWMVGGGFLGFGLYRLWHVVSYFRTGGAGHQR